MVPVDRIRTVDLPLTRRLLYQLSYASVFHSGVSHSISEER